MKHFHSKVWSGLTLVFALQSGSAAADQVVETGHGRIEGTDLGAVHAFLGVPYAAPPVGELRWAAPAPPASWRGVRHAKDYGASCTQEARGPFGPYTHEFVDQAKAPSEDCLTLNVWTPDLDASLPILVWIHGGAFIGGASSVPIYDGEHLAAQGIVVVSVNYRLGAFGFFTNPALRKEQGKVAGLQGIYDIVAALGWLHENAAAFGGDPGRITVAGQSAGAAAVNILLALEDSRGLFSGAISQSMPLGGFPMRSVADGDGFAESLERGVAAESLDALREVPAAAILAATNLIAPGPMAPIEPDAARAIADLPLHDVPIMAGTTADESRFPGSRLEYRVNVAGRYGLLADEFLDVYPAGNDDEARDMANTSVRDRHALGLARFAHRSGGAPVYLYRFVRVPPGPDAEVFGAFHSAEIPYVFGTLDVAPERNYGADDRTVSERMAAYWVNFVRTGNPNGDALPQWPGATREQPVLMQLGGPWEPESSVPPARASFFRAWFDAGGTPSLF
jgi:para-nitrobenzyl esterase